MRNLFPNEPIRSSLVEIAGTKTIAVVVDAYRKWLTWVALNFKQIPLDYTEWTLAGQLANAATTAKIYAISEFTITKPGGGKVRPDLYLWRKGSADIAFEIKKVRIDLHQSAYSIREKWIPHLEKANSKLADYRAESLDRCSLIVAPIMVAGTKWNEESYDNQINYAEAIMGLRNKASQILGTLTSTQGNFLGGFVSTHAEAKDERNLFKYRPRYKFAIGAICVGRLRPDGTLGR